MDVGGWLRSLGLSEYEPAFRDNQIDGEVLRNLTVDDLKELGVASVGHRRKLLSAIAELSGRSAEPTIVAKARRVEAPAHDAAERRQLTVMFCDLVGSTAMSAKLDPEDMHGIIGAYHKCCASLIERGGGFVAKYMGDGVLAYFGYPQAHEHDAERAVRAGLAIVEAAPKLVTIIGAPLQVRVGIATGIVVVGDLLGSGEAQERGVVGETPNLAARLQGIAQPDSVVIGDGTRRLVGNLFELVDLGPHDLKGITGPTRAYVALKESSQESRFEALHADKLTTLVGREEESELLLRCWAKAKARKGQVVLLSGEGGIGKSRLTAALLERLAGEPHIRMRYFCSPQHTDSALYPIIGHMARAAGLTRDDDPKVKLDKLDALLAMSDTSQEDAGLLADMLSLPNDGRYPALELSPQQRRQKTLEALIGQIEAIAGETPVLMIFEDAHWVDPSSLEVFGRLTDKIDSLRVLLLVTFRPEFAAPWVGRPHVTALMINRLAPLEVMALIDRVAGGKPLAANIRQDIVERADGIPLFVEEMTKAVLEAEGEGAAARAIASIPSPALAVPASLHASLMARLDRLGDAKAVAQIGAVIGREFSHTLLAFVAELPESAFNSTLDQLLQSGLLSRHGVPPHASYQFKHALVRDAAYGTLLRSNRQQLHARVSNVLSERFPETAVTTPELLAQHCTAAGLTTQAISNWLKAGQAAMQRSALIEAISHLSNGLDLLPAVEDERSRLELEVGLQAIRGLTLATARGYAVPEVAECYGRARELCDQIGNVPQLFPVLYGLFIFHWCRGHLKSARASAEEMRSIAASVGDPALLLVGHSALGNIDWHLGQNEVARKNIQSAMAWYDEKEHASLAAVFGQEYGGWTLCYSEFANISLGRLNEAAEAGSRAMSITRALGHPFSLCAALAMRAASMILLRDPIAALKLADECVELAGAQGFPHWVAKATVYRGWALAQLGNIATGIEQIEQGIAGWRAVGSDIALGWHFACLAETQLLDRQPDAALQSTNEALKWIERNSEDQFASLAHIRRGDAYCALEEVGSGQTEYEIAIETALQQEARFWQLRASTRLASLWHRQGRRVEAHGLLAPIYGWFTEGFDMVDLKEARELLEELA